VRNLAPVKTARRRYDVGLAQLPHTLKGIKKIFIAEYQLDGAVGCSAPLLGKQGRERGYREMTRSGQFSSTAMTDLGTRPPMAHGIDKTETEIVTELLETLRLRGHPMRFPRPQSAPALASNIWRSSSGTRTLGAWVTAQGSDISTKGECSTYWDRIPPRRNIRISRWAISTAP